MPDLVERTAIAAFELSGREVRVGQIVTLDRNQVKRLAAAGCVHEADEDNAAATKADLPPTQRADVDREAGDAAGKLEVIRQSVTDAQVDADLAVADHATRAREAGVEADKAIEEHQARVAKAKEDADAAVKAHDQRAASAKAAADKAEEEAANAPKAKSGDKAKA